jgi:hypothetical protein
MCQSRSAMNRRDLLLGGALLLVACETVPPPRPTFPDIRFTQKPPLRIDAAGLDIERAYRATLQAPNVEHLFPVTPERAMENWARDRLQPVGTSRRVRVRILDASVKEIELPKTPGVRGAFTTDQAQRYDATAEMTVDLMGERGFPERSVAAKASRSRTVPENITPNDRERVWYELTQALMTDLDAELERQIRANFGFYLQS